MDKKCETSSSSDEPCEEIDVNLPRSKKGKCKYTRESLAERQLKTKKKQSKKQTKRNTNKNFVEKRLTILVGNVKKEKFSNNKIGNVNCHEMVSATTLKP
jgi:hypothetical protein